VHKTLKELKKIGKRLIIISNASTEFIEFQIERTNIKKYFESIFSATSDFRLTKKTTKVYKKVCNNLKILPHQMLHIGDDQKFDFIVPGKLGISAFHLDRTGTIKEEYTIHNLKNLTKKIVNTFNKSINKS
jgi:HAD superfamily hydrolase (TIGR01549 family)